MQAIILAAGDSTRYEGNKLLTPFNGKLLVEYAIDFCIENGIRNIYITLSPHIAIKDNPIYQTLVKNYGDIGTHPNLKLNFKIQDADEYGPAAAIKVWKDDINQDDFIVLMGDNFIQGKLDVENLNENVGHCTIGYLELEDNVDNLKFAHISEHTNKVIEKPHQFRSGKFFIGFAYFGINGMEKIDNIKPSKRGELEITDFINAQENIELYDMTQLKWVDITFKYENPDVDNYIKNATSEPTVYRFFDWDQTLVESDRLLYEAYSYALKPWNYSFSYEYFMKAIYPDSTAFMRATGIDDMETIDLIKKSKEEYYTRHLEDLEFNENLWDIIDQTSNPINEYNAIVTNTSADLVNEILYLCQMNEKDHIKFIIGSDTVPQRKPYPNLYLEAFENIHKNFNYEKDTLEIYEDSLEGLTAATAFLNELKNGYNGFKEIKNFKIIHVTDNH